MSNPQSPNLPKKTNGILTTPSESIVIVPRTYTEDEQAKIVALREYANTLRLPEDDPYYPWESKFLADPGCAERYMRAAKFKLDDAKKRIVGTLAWRREYKPELIPPEEVRIESETGKIILNGFDCNGRPIITMHPGRENTKPSERQLRHLVYVLERAIDLMPPGQDSLVIIVDYRSATLRTNPSISVASKVLTILQHHYVERLGRAIVVNLPFILSFFYKGIAPFLDPVTRDKMRFNPDLKELVPDDHLDAELGGSYHYEFEPKTYWDSLISACHIAEDGTRTTAKGPELAIYSDPIGSEGKTAVKSNQKGDDNGNTDNGNDRVVKRTSNSQSSTTTTSDDGDLEPRTPAAGVTVNDDTQKALSSSEKFRDAIHENDREAKISDPETEATTVLVEPVNF